MSEHADNANAVDNADDSEAQARRLGWAPREKWRGRPEEFVEADEFLRRGREVLPIVQSQVDKARAENEQLKRELAQTRADFDRRVKTTERMTARLLEQQQAQLTEEFEAKKRAAAAAGDTAAYDNIRRQEDRAYAKIAEDAKAAKEAPDVQTPPQQPPEVQDWAKKNDWFFRDKALAMEAEALHIALLRDHPGLALQENLERVTNTIRSRYPDKFGEPAAATPRERNFSAVEGGSSAQRGASNSRERGWKELPSEDRAACDQLIERGYLKGDPKKARENYARTYWQEYGE